MNSYVICNTKTISEHWLEVARQLCSGGDRQLLLKAIHENERTIFSVLFYTKELKKSTPPLEDRKEWIIESVVSRINQSTGFVKIIEQYWRRVVEERDDRLKEVGVENLMDDEEYFFIKTLTNSNIRYYNSAIPESIEVLNLHKDGVLLWDDFKPMDELFFL